MAARPVLSDSGFQAMILTIWGLLACGILVSLRWFALRRHTQPIKGRGTWTVVTVQLLCLALISFDAAQYIFPSGYPCALHFWYLVVCVSLFGSVYVARCWKLYFSIRLAEEISFGQISHFQPADPARKARHSTTDEAAANMRKGQVEAAGERAVTLAKPVPEPLKEPSHHSRDSRTSDSLPSSFTDLEAPDAAITVVPPEPMEMRAASRSRQSSLINGGDVKQQNLLNMALSLRVDTSSAALPSDPAQQLGLPSATLSVQTPSFGSSAPSENEDSGLLSNSGPNVPVSSTAFFEQAPSEPSPAVAVNAGTRTTPHGAVVIPILAIPPHTEDSNALLDPSFKTSPRVKSGSVASDGATHRSQVFAATDNGSFIRGSVSEPKAIPESTEEAVAPKSRHHAVRGWFMENRYLQSKAALLSIVSVLSFVSILPAVIVFAKTSNDSSATGSCVAHARGIYIGVLILCYLALIAPMFFFFRLRNDAFSIIRELALTGSGALIGAFMAALSRTTALNDWTNEVFPLDDLGLMVIAASFWISGMVYPIYRSYALENSLANETREALDHIPLSAVLDDAEGLELFATHLQSEFSLENLVFWECVEDFRSMTALIPERALRYRLALRVFDSCVRPRSMFEVNLPSMVRKNIIDDLFPNGRSLPQSHSNGLHPTRGDDDQDPEQFIQRNALSGIEMNRLVLMNANHTNIESTFFDAAQFSIFQLMNSDSFVRFTHTAAYKDFVRRYKARKSQATPRNLPSPSPETGSPTEVQTLRRQRGSTRVARQSVSADGTYNNGATQALASLPEITHTGRSSPSAQPSA